MIINSRGLLTDIKSTCEFNIVGQNSKGISNLLADALMLFLLLSEISVITFLVPNHDSNRRGPMYKKC